MKLNILFLCSLILLTGCTYRPADKAWTEKTIETKYLSFQVWEKQIKAGEPLRIYIEGDGNPTPKNPIAFQLAQNDPKPNVIYVSRPCQYVWCEECKNPAIWQEERFNEEIVDEMKNLVLYLAKKYKPGAVELVGYDGGGTMAMLIASKLPISKVITVGGILDIKNYMENQGVKLNGMNPTDSKGILAKIPQIHYVGGRDTITPRRNTERFVGSLYMPKSAVVKVVPNATHTDWGNLTVE